MEKPLTIGIVGSSASGKTTLAKHLGQIFGAYKPAILSMDNYYKPIDLQKKDSTGEINFDLPEAIYAEKLLADIKDLKKGVSITCTPYLYNNPHLQAETSTIYPSKILIVEGVFTLHYSSLCSELDYTVFLDVPPEIQLERRIQRDVKERNMKEESIRYQWYNHVLPCFEAYLLPYLQKVDYNFQNKEEISLGSYALIETIRTRFNLSE